MASAPLYTDIADAPPGGQASWCVTSDGIRIRVALWSGGDKGTMLIFPGRTEYIEKYGPVVGELLKRGYAAVVIDWRGQGLSDRVTDKQQLGHVGAFSDYQLDIAAMLEAVENAGLPQPLHLLSHSMGGAIALRALHEGLAVEKVIFSAPMWGIYVAPHLRPLVLTLAHLAGWTGLGKNYVPTTGPKNYVQGQEFAGNTLTNHPPTYQWLQDQLIAHPDLGLGGPSLDWLRLGIAEAKTLVAKPPPNRDCLCFLGSQEEIVESSKIKELMGRWANGNLVQVDQAQHEILMETPDVQAQAWHEIGAYLSEETVAAS